MRIDKFGFESECIKIYNPENQELLGTYDTYTKAERATGITSKVLRIAAKTKTRRFSPLLNKQVAIRLAAKKTTQHVSNTTDSNE